MAQADFLLERAKSFFGNAHDLLRKGEYALAAFSFEQAAQLHLKYILFLKLKQFPPTHSLRELLRAIGKAYVRQKEVDTLIEKNIHLIVDLEQAYITSRYLPAEFSKNQVKDMETFVQQLIEFLKKL